MRRPPPYIVLLWSVWRAIFGKPACNHHGEVARRCHMEEQGDAYMLGYGRTLGAATPRCYLPATTFCMAVVCWA
jgi:hypothetical protein